MSCFKSRMFIIQSGLTMNEKVNEENSIYSYDDGFVANYVSRQAIDAL